MNALADKAHKQGIPLSDMHSDIIQPRPHYSTTIPAKVAVLFVCVLCQPVHSLIHPYIS